MKTFLSLLLIFAVTTTALFLDAQRLDAGVLFVALAVAALFAIALNDRPMRHRLPPPGSVRAFCLRLFGSCRVCLGE